MGFVFVHMIGNLKMYLGRRGLQPLRRVRCATCCVPLLPRTVALWLLRIGLIVAFVFHIHAAYSADPR